MKLGYKASAEHFGPVELLEFARHAERVGLEIVGVSDHFQPWRHHGGHGPAALTWLGAAAVATERAVLGTSVLTPTLRYHPSVVAPRLEVVGHRHYLQAHALRVAGQLEQLDRAELLRRRLVAELH